MLDSLAYLFAIPRQCPHCGTTRIDRVPRRGAAEVLLLPLFRLQAFSCHDCLWRFYSWKHERRQHADPHAPQSEHPIRWPVHVSKLCPLCGDSRTRRSHRNHGKERLLLPLLRVWPFRCMSCHHRFYAFRLGTSHGRDRLGQNAH